MTKEKNVYREKVIIKPGLPGCPEDDDARGTMGGRIGSAGQRIPGTSGRQVVKK